jgi:hypothetical protein
LPADSEDDDESDGEDAVEGGVGTGVGTGVAELCSGAPLDGSTERPGDDSASGACPDGVPQAATATSATTADPALHQRMPSPPGRSDDYQDAPMPPCG